MTQTAVTKTDQYALLTLISKKLGGPEHRFGKKALQKTVHLMQELGGVDAGYNFSFYTYGPYSSELSGDLDIAAAANVLTVAYNPSENYYLIGPSTEADRAIKNGQKFLQSNQAEIDRIIEAFGGRLAKDLELVSTIAYLHRHAPKSEFADDDKLLARVKDLKPKYSTQEIAKAIKEVRGFLAK